MSAVYKPRNKHNRTEQTTGRTERLIHTENYKDMKEGRQDGRVQGLPRPFMLFAGSLSGRPESSAALSLCKHRWVGSPDRTRQRYEGEEWRRENGSQWRTLKARHTQGRRLCD